VSKTAEVAVFRKQGAGKAMTLFDRLKNEGISWQTCFKQVFLLHIGVAGFFMDILS